MDDVKVVEYKGYKTELSNDDFSDFPDARYDKNLFLVAYHRDFEIRRDDIITKQEAIDLSRGKGKVKITKKYWHFGLEAYIHSGVVLALSYEGNFCDRRWDVSQLGLVLASKKEWKTEESAKEAARGLIETWNMYLGGDVWTMKIFDGKGIDIENCGGFYGYDTTVVEAKKIIDNNIKTKGAN